MLIEKRYFTSDLSILSYDRKVTTKSNNHAPGEVGKNRIKYIGIDIYLIQGRV